MFTEFAINYKCHFVSYNQVPKINSVVILGHYLHAKYLYLYWYLDNWYWYLLVKYLIQDCL